MTRSADLFGSYRRLMKRLNLRGRWLRSDYAIQRVTAETLLADFSQKTEEVFDGAVLVDGNWDNPNHWVRYVLLRRALGLQKTREVGLLGQYNRKECRQTFERFGIHDIVQFEGLYGDRDRNLREAKQLLSQTKTSEDILAWQLPYGFPPSFVYDGLIKRQQTACVNLDDPKLPLYVAEALGCLVAADRLLKAYHFKLLVLSHVINFLCGALAWLAAQRNILVVLSYGEFNVPKFSKIHAPMQIYDALNHPSSTEMMGLDPARLEALRQAGANYIEKRLAGQTSDLSGIYAFQMRNAKLTRSELCNQLGWKLQRPIISVYVPTWFDFPHMFGTRHFRDFLEWLEVTWSVMTEADHVNWLIKAHPCEEWYGGMSLHDIVSSPQRSHIQFVPERWSGATLVDATDGLITYHGTGGIEYAAMGKPVLLADAGWYHDLGIAKWPKSREEYLNDLAHDWWRSLNLKETRRRAEILAGWHFCHPAWQQKLLFEDDPVQAPIYGRLPALFYDNEEAIAREIDTIRRWFHSDHRHYHTFKMGLADTFLF